MSQLTEIRWHARAGQGAVTAAKLVADTALLTGAYIQAMPEYGPERTGAPLKAYTRISPEPIELHNNITHPNLVVVLDDTLLDTVNICEGLKDEGTIILNTKMDAVSAREKISCGPKVRVAVVDATGIAMDTIKRDMPNTPIVGALAHVTELIPLNALEDKLVATFSKKFSQAVIDANLASIKRAAQEVELS